MENPMKLNHSEGLLLGQSIGDALGAYVEFKSAREIARLYPNGVRELKSGGVWCLAKGQVTDDTEMAYCLSHALIEAQGFDPQLISKWYRRWQHSDPFDMGHTTSAGLNNRPNYDSQANGALMRISPLAIVGQNWSDEDLIASAKAECAITHPNQVCQEANALFVLLLRRCLTSNIHSKELLILVKEDAKKLKVSEMLVGCIEKAPERFPITPHQTGWVVYAFHNALHQLITAPSFEEALVDTIAQGGDTDTTGAICGALMGAYFGRSNIPPEMISSVLNCHPNISNSEEQHPRPDFLWPSQTLDLVQGLISVAFKAYTSSPLKIL